MRLRRSALYPLLLCASLAGTASATEIIASSTGLSSPASTITFEQIVLPQNTVVTTQYAGLGVSFAPNVYFSPQTNFGNVQGNDVGNYNTSASFTLNPVILNFTTPETAVAFSMDADTTPYLFQALLGSTVVDSFTSTVGVSTSDYYGFSGETFNAISITEAGTGGGAFFVLDNIQFGAVATSATPEPSSLILLATGLAGAAGVLKRRFV